MYELQIQYSVAFLQQVIDKFCDHNKLRIMTKKIEVAPDISCWKRSLQKKAEKQERIRREVLQSVYQALNRLSEEYSWDDVFIFGSVTRSGKFSDDSDIDIGIQGLNKFLLYQFVGKMSMLLDRDVDVVRLEECRFAEKIIRRGIRWTKNRS